MFKLDLHTHSIVSPDGGITAEQYQRALESGLLDSIAITDHNRIDFATYMHEQLGDRIIVGEEIMTSVGEVIGLYLQTHIQPGLTIQETIKQIKDQGGLVYVPHPFEQVRKGLHPAVMEELHDFLDIVEVCNGRALLQNRSAQAVVWTRLNHVIQVASSDAHGFYGLGKTFTSVSEVPTRDNMMEQLASGKLLTDRPTMRALLYPKYHRLRKKVRKT